MKRIKAGKIDRKLTATNLIVTVLKLTKYGNKVIVNNAQVVKLVDTLASGASARKGVEVQVLSWAPLKKPAHASFLCPDNAEASDGIPPARWRRLCDTARRLVAKP